MWRAAAPVIRCKARDYVPLSFAPITEAQRTWLCQHTCRWLLIFCQAEAVGSYGELLGKLQTRHDLAQARRHTPIQRRPPWHGLRKSRGGLVSARPSTLVWEASMAFMITPWTTASRACTRPKNP